MQFGNQHFRMDVRAHIRRAASFGNIGSCLHSSLDFAVTVELAEVAGILQRSILHCEEPQCSCSPERSPMSVSWWVTVHKVMGCHGPFTPRNCSCCPRKMEKNHSVLLGMCDHWAIRFPFRTWGVLFCVHYVTQVGHGINECKPCPGFHPHGRS